MAVDRVVDFSQCEIRDCEWHNKLSWLARGYQSKLEAEHLQNYLQMNTSALGTHVADWYNRKQTDSLKNIESLDRLRRPWLYRNRAEPGATIDWTEEKAKYKQAFGVDVDDPDDQAFLERALEFIEAGG